MATSILTPNNISNIRTGAWTTVYSGGTNPVSGFSGTVRIVVELSGGNLKLDSTSGVTTVLGYGSLTSGTATSIAFEGTQANVNAALRSLQVKNDTADAKPTLTISAVKGGSAYNPANGHYYEFVEVTNKSWTAAKADAEARTFNGLTGYLATITSSAENAFIISKVGGNAWIGGSDAGQENTWTWRGGPEAGQTFYVHGGNNAGRYSTWQSGEPNNSLGSEHYAQIISVNTGSLVAGKWNDLSNSGGSDSYTVTGYVVEYGGYQNDNPTEAVATSTTTLIMQSPPDITSNGGDATATLSYTENGTGAVTTVTATDPNTGDSKTYSISGADSAKFSIGATTGVLTFNAPPDYENPTDNGGDNSYQVTVRVTDSTGRFDEQTLTIQVTDLNDNAPVFTSGATGSVAENAATSTVIYQAASTDADGTSANRAVTYSLKAGAGDDATLLNINASTGAVTLKTSANFEDKASYSFTVVATNVGTGGTQTTEQAVTVSITDVNETPVITAGTTTAFTEQIDTAVAPGITIFDEDHVKNGNWDGGTLTVQITAGNTTNDVLRLPLTNPDSSPGSNAIWLDTTAGNALMSGTTQIGTADAASASDSTVWTFTLNELATNDAVQALARAVLFTNDSDNPGTGNRTVSFTATDGGSLAASATQTVTITLLNDAPILHNAADSAPTLTTISEDATDNLGNLISTLVRPVDGSTDASGVTEQSFASDVDFFSQGSSDGERYDGGLAIYAFNSSGPADGGHWQYKIGSGAWTNVGTVSESAALLLASSDSIRFVPDGDNATTATLSYYLWDGSSGSAGNKVSVASRGGSTAFSLDGDEATLTVTHVNDAPTLDLDSASAGNDYTTVFRPRGEAVAVVGNIAIRDVDKLASGSDYDYLTGATVSISAGALDNLFGTIYETLALKAGGVHGSDVTSYAGSLGTIEVSGNGTPALTLTGKGSWADYEAALKSVYYLNSNPNAFEGDRSLTITVTDGALTVGEDAVARLTTTATTTVQTPWTTVADLNGTADGRDHAVTFTEDSAGVAVAASNASLDNQAVNIKTVTLALRAAPDHAAERLFVSDTLVTTLTGLGITVQGNSSHTLTLAATNSVSGVTATTMQLALRAVQYDNHSQNPSAADRHVDVSVVDVNTTGVGATTTITVVPVNDAPSSITLSADTVELSADTSARVAVATITITDVDSTTHTLTLNGADADAFEVDGDTLYLKAGTVLDASAQPSYAITLTADDGSEINHTYSQAFSIRVKEDIAPVFSLATVSGNQLTLVFDDQSPLDPGKVPASTAFAVPGYTVTAVAVPDDRSKTVVLTLNAEPSGAITVAYTQPGGGDGLQDTSANALASFTAQPVIHGSFDTDTRTLTVNAGGSVQAPIGDFTLINNQGDPVIITGLKDGQSLTTSGNGPALISNPDGDLHLNNTGSGPVTIDGLQAGTSLHSTGDQPVLMDLSHLQAGETITIDNDGSGVIHLAKMPEGVTVNSTGSGSGINYVPTLSGVPSSAQGITVGSPAALADFSVGDQDSTNILTVTLTTTNGILGGLIDADPSTPGIQLSGSAADINTALAAATFTASAAGAASITIRVSDGVFSTPTLATYQLTASAPSNPTTPTTPTTPSGVIENPVSNTTTTPSGGTQTTTTGTLGGAAVVETLTRTPAGETVRELVFTPTTTGNPAAPVVLPLLYETDAGSTSNTTVSLPSGLGLVSVGDRTPVADGQQHLLALIAATVPGSDSARQDMLSGGRSFLDALPQDSTLWVNQLQLTAPSGLSAVPGAPVVVSGAASDPTGAARGKIEALVIDGSALPAGSEIELQDVDFAVVVGNLTLRGGPGASMVFGDDHAQFIMLGAGDDVIYGGGGDDTLGSESGSNRLFGNAGNDSLLGGDGQDFLHGGTDADVAVFTGSINRYEIIRDHGKTLVRSLDRPGDIDTLVNIETLRFDDADYNVENAPQHTWIASLYSAVFDRQADLDGFQYWAGRYEAGEGIGDIALSFLYSVEYQSGGGAQFASLSAAQQLDLLYQHFLGRTPDAAGHDYWMGRMADGLSINDIAHSFVLSNEMQAAYVAPNCWEFLI
ncbi:MAG: cadherin domain-containing protein [Thauera sp.]|nr:cadherin domain-containing protein [Thauera sp.]